MTENVPAVVSEQAAAEKPVHQMDKSTAPIWQTFQLKRLPAFREDKELFNFQQYAVYRAITTPRFIYGLATGTGKTVCSYSAYFYYRLKFPNTKLIILTNKSAVLQFHGEIENFFDVPDFKAMAIGPKMKQIFRMSGKTYADCRKQAYDGFSLPVGTVGSVDCLILNYSVFRSDYRKLLKKYIEKLKKNGCHLMLVADEATKFKNLSSDTFHCVSNLASYTERSIAATATITKGKLEEIYAVMKGIGIQIYPTKEAFLDAHCITFTPPGGNRFQPQVVGYKNVAKFVEMMKPYSIVLRKQDVAPFLPKFTSSIDWIEHSEEQFNLIREIYSGYVNLAALRGEDPDLAEKPLEAHLPTPEMKEGEEEAQSLMDGDFKMIDKITETGYIKRILLDTRTVTQEGLHDYQHMSPKTQAIIESLQDDYVGEKLVIYTHSKIYLKLLAETIRRCKDVPDYYKNVLEIHGEVGDFEREANRQKFYNDPNYNIMILNDAGLESLNLQAANILIVTTMPSSAGNLVQLAGRISRIGSTHSNLYIRYLLTENSQDADEYAIVQSQLLVMFHAQGESEEGLIDWNFLQHQYGAKNRNGARDAVEQDELLQMSSARLMLAKREKRAKDYV